MDSESSGWRDVPCDTIGCGCEDRYESGSVLRVYRKGEIHDASELESVVFTESVCVEGEQA